jgi:DNA-binding IclR family transcriptional regulator
VSSRSVVLVPADRQRIADALRQIEAEYREMPGLSVTEAQAQRLWGLDKTTCRRALETLVQRGVLRRNRRESYVRAEMFSRLSAVSTSGALRNRR